jgi:hypothetical protein
MLTLADSSAVLSRLMTVLKLRGAPAAVSATTGRTIPTITIRRVMTKPSLAIRISSNGMPFDPVANTTRSM